jgi:site-specific recombinase XerD
LEVLLGPEGKRKLRLRTLSNDQLIELYDSELVLRLHNVKNLSDTRKILARLKEHLGNYPPSAELAKSFLAQYANRQPRTLYRYAQMVKAFMKWYGEPIEDLKIKVPKSIPKYTEDAAFNQVRDAIANKKTHKACVTRDLLLFDLEYQSGLRRGELYNLFVRDVHPDFLEVRKGKGGKDRIVPLVASMSLRLQNFIKDNHLKPDDRIFNLTPGSISNKIRHFADKAGISDLHTHSLRHKFATNLLEQGTNIRVVQDLMGHENLNTTQVYLSVTDKAKKEAINQLDEPKDDAPGKPNHPTLPTSDLLIEVYDTSIGYSGDAGYPRSDGSMIWLRIECAFSASTIVLIESVKLDMAGEGIPALDWKSDEVNIPINEYLYFPIAKSVTQGQHNVQLMAFAEGRWRLSKPFSVNVPMR